MTTPALKAAEHEAAAARHDLADSVAELKVALDPRIRVRAIVDELRTEATSYANQGVSFVQRNPALVAGTAASAMTLVFAAWQLMKARKKPRRQGEGLQLDPNRYGVAAPAVQPGLTPEPQPSRPAATAARP